MKITNYTGAKGSVLTPLAALIASVLTVACGGGGGVLGPTISGIAATGAAFGGATVTITDSSGATTSCPSLTDANTGLFSCTLPLTAVAPFVIRAYKSDGVGSTEQQFSVVSEANNGATTTANITPLTTAVVAMLSPTGDPASFADQVKGTKGLASAAAVNAQVATLQNQLQTLIDATVGNGATINPMTTPFNAGTSKGMDKLLDAVNVSTTASTSGGTAQVSIALKANPEAKLTFVNGATAPTKNSIDAPAVSAVQSTINTNPTALIADLINRMNACYALDVATRVAKTDGTGTAEDVSAAACKTLFTQENPSLFKSGGNQVGAKGAFKTLFSSDATGTIYDQGNLEYVINNTDTTNYNNTANNGYWVVSYRSTDKVGNVSYGKWALKKEGTDLAPVLRQAGNQYDYDTGVSAFAQSRHFPNQPTSDYLSTGYSLNITNKAGSTGSSIFQKVEVTPPIGDTLTLKPLAGCSFLGLWNGTKTSCTNFVRLSSAYTAASTTNNATMPSIDTTNLYFVSPSWTDNALAAVSTLGKWTFKITLADGTVVTQINRSISRAPTIAELSKQAFVAQTSAGEADVIASTASTGYYLLTGSDARIDLSNGWNVPTGALAPTTITAFGNAPNNGIGFNDSVTVLANARTAKIDCSRQSSAHAHCASTVSVGGTGNYAAGTTVREIQFNASTAKDVTWSMHVGFYKPQI